MAGDTYRLHSGVDDSIDPNSGEHDGSCPLRKVTVAPGDLMAGGAAGLVAAECGVGCWIIVIGLQTLSGSAPGRGRVRSGLVRRPPDDGTSNQFVVQPVDRLSIWSVLGTQIFVGAGSDVVGRAAALRAAVRSFGRPSTGDPVGAYLRAAFNADGRTVNGQLPWHHVDAVGVGGPPEHGAVVVFEVLR